MELVARVVQVSTTVLKVIHEDIKVVELIIVIGGAVGGQCYSS